MVESQTNQSVADVDAVNNEQPDESENQQDFSSDSVNNETELQPGELGCRHYRRACML